MADFIPLIVIVVGAILFFMFLLALFNRFLVKCMPGQALVITGFGLTQPLISLSSAFVVPLFRRVETVDLTVKTVRISRKSNDSLSCADGIRAEVEVDFYIQINPLEEDIRRVATTIGPERAAHLQTVRELFEAKFADALKTAGSKLSFDQLYQNRALFRDEILKALGQEGMGDVVLNGYKLDDVAIQYLEQLPLDQHDENNVLDAKGRKEIAQRTSSEAEAANHRLRQKEVTIAEQNREARIRQLNISQELAQQEARQEREVKEAQAREQALTQQTVAEQDRLAMQAGIERDKSIKIAEERKQQDVLATQIAREKATQVSEQEKEKEIEIARIQREIAQAEALKQKLVTLEHTAKQEAEKIRAEEQAKTVQALEVANRQQQIEVISAQKEAQVEIAKRNVESDVESYKLITVAKARLESAELDAQAAGKQAQAIMEVGRAEAEALRMKLDAENIINEKVILATLLRDLVPQLPTIIEKLMLPAEKIDSIKVLNIGGMESVLHGGSSMRQAEGDSAGAPMNSIINSVVGAGLAMPFLKEIMKTIQGDDSLASSIDELRQHPAGAQLLNLIESKKGA